MKKIKFIDLFAGLGGTRIGFEQACEEENLSSECVFTSEIKPYAVQIYKHNFSDDIVHGDITKINAAEIPDFDFLLGGFPCQAFSIAGRKAGFDDARGTLFFDIAKILKEKKPKGFLLENVEGLVTHDKRVKTSNIGNTLETIITILTDLGYEVSWQVLNAKDFGVAQTRKRIYIACSLVSKPQIREFEVKSQTFGDIQEHNLTPLNSAFTKNLLKLFSEKELEGKSIKDKRGGDNNIHSWDMELKGKITREQKILMNTILTQRRRKKWAEIKGIVWMDGMPLTLNEVHSFCEHIDREKLRTMLDDLVEKKYLRFEHPKNLVEKDGKKLREYAFDKEPGYNIVTGKLSFELNKILGKSCVAPTIVATEADRIGVLDNGYIRRLSENECLRFFGFPTWYQSNITHKELYDLIGNTVVVPVIKSVSQKIIRTLK